jgi:enediyne biosynthesis protein E4
MSGHRYIAEIMGPGVALFDYDNDGDLDVYAVQGQKLNVGEQPADSHDKLFRSDLHVAANGSRTLRFTDVSAQAGLVPRSYGMGVAAADIDNDGWTDLYLTRLGADVLLKNNGNGTFTDVFARAGLSDPGWTVAASFFDMDRDGWLDLFVPSYVRYSLASDIECIAPTGVRDYCSPQSYVPLPGRLFWNMGRGIFQDVTLNSGIAKEYGPALGTITFDADRDGWPDVYVANDGTENQLWLNRRNRSFVNNAVLAGVAVNGSGKAEGSMGVDAGDFDNDGDDDLVIANLTGEGATLYENDGTGIFRDVAAARQLRPRSLAYTGFGAAWFDADNDGWLDILTVNGAIETIQALAAVGDSFPLHQRKQLFRNVAGTRFDDVTAEAGAAFATSEVGRGAAFGDIDNDGDVDVVVANNNGRLRLLVNERGNRSRWLGVRVLTDRGRDAFGAQVQLVLADGTTRQRRVRSDGSYASANDPRVLFGLGDRGEPRRLRVRWPDGRVSEWPWNAVNQWVLVQDGGSPR